MTTLKYNEAVQEELISLVLDKEKLDKNLLKAFMTYWWIRKSHSLLTAFEFRQIKASATIWIKLIESNHTFRVKYGDRKADEIIRLVQEKRIFKNRSLTHH